MGYSCSSRSGSTKRKGYLLSGFFVFQTDLIARHLPFHMAENMFCPGKFPDVQRRKTFFFQIFQHLFPAKMPGRDSEAHKAPTEGLWAAVSGWPGRPLLKGPARSVLPLFSAFSPLSSETPARCRPGGPGRDFSAGTPRIWPVRLARTPSPRAPSEPDVKAPGLSCGITA